MTQTIYVMVDPRDNRPFYVGRTSLLLHDRLKRHRKDRYGSSRRSRKINEILLAGYVPRMVAVMDAKVGLADLAEQCLWAVLGAMNIELCNTYMPTANRYNEAQAERLRERFIDRCAGLV